MTDDVNIRKERLPISVVINMNKLDFLYNYMKYDNDYILLVNDTETDKKILVPLLHGDLIKIKTHIENIYGAMRNQYGKNIMLDIRREIRHMIDIHDITSIHNKMLGRIPAHNKSIIVGEYIKVDKNYNSDILIYTYKELLCEKIIYTIKKMDGITDIEISSVDIID